MSRRRKPITALCRAMPRATRIALEELFWYWLRHDAPDRFRRLAFQKYPREFGDSAKRDRQRWLKRHAQDVKRGKKSRDVNPLRESGKLERAFLSGTVLFTGSNTRLRAKWPSLPRYAKMRNRYSDFSIADALVAVSREDVKQLERLFKAWLLRNLANIANLPEKSGGRYAL